MPTEPRPEVGVSGYRGYVIEASIFPGVLAIKLGALTVVLEYTGDVEVAKRRIDAWKGESNGATRLD